MRHVETPQSFCRFGLAHGDITPPADIYHRMWGAATHDRATGIHRPLRATVAIFAPADETAAADPANRQVLIALDHCILGRDEMQNLLNFVSAKAKVPRESLIVIFSHTHGAGLMGLERQSLPGGDLIPGYLDRLHHRLAELVSDAQQALQPAVIAYGVGRCDLARNRDFWDDQTQQFVCGFNPAGVADDTVLVARVNAARTDATTGGNAPGPLLATMVNYACHPTTLAWGNTLVSPDYPGAMREVIEQATGAQCLFVQGASADLGPLEGFVGDPAVADRNGRQLGYAALSAITALAPPATTFVFDGPVVSGATLGAWSHRPLSDERRRQAARWALRRWIIELDYRPGRPTLAQAHEELKHWTSEEARLAAGDDAEAAREARAMLERKVRLVHRLERLAPGDRFPLEAALWRVGDVFWLALQGEFYQVLQTSLRHEFPDTPIVVATIASDWGASYLPPANLYDRGIYQESIALVAPGSLEQVIQEVKTQIAAMR